MTVEREVRFGSLDRSRWESVDVTLDTGSAHCLLPASLAGRLGAVPEFQQRLILADGTVATESIGHVVLAMDDSLPVIITTVIIGGEDAPPVVGHIALEQLSVGIDPATGKLVPDLSVLLFQSGWETL